MKDVSFSARKSHMMFKAVLIILGKLKKKIPHILSSSLVSVLHLTPYSTGRFSSSSLSLSVSPALYTHTHTHPHRFDGGGRAHHSLYPVPLSPVSPLDVLIIPVSHVSHALLTLYGRLTAMFSTHTHKSMLTCVRGITVLVVCAHPLSHVKK